MKFVEEAAKNVELATEAALKALNVDRSKVTIEVLDNGGFFRKAKVRATLLPTEGEKAVLFIEKLMTAMNVPCTVELVETEERANIEIIGTDVAPIIGYRGEVLDAIQHIASQIANKGRDEYKRIVVDTENYRAKRETSLVELAQKLADKAVRTGRRVELEPMNAHERRIIHAALQANEAVTTHSEGDEPNRFLVIISKNAKPPRFDRNNRSNNNANGNRNGNTQRNGNSNGNRGGFNKGNGSNYGNRDGGNRSEGRNENRGGGRPYNNRPRNNHPAAQNAVSSEETSTVTTAVEENTVATTSAQEDSAVARKNGYKFGAKTKSFGPKNGQLR